MGLPGLTLAAAARRFAPVYTKPCWITDTRYGTADSTGVNDCSDVIEAIWAAGYQTLLLPAGGIFKITRTIDLGQTRSIIGAGRPNRSSVNGAPRIMWAGATGGRAISSFTIASNDGGNICYSGNLVGFALLYPSTKLAAGSVGIYLGRPTGGRIADIQIHGNTDDNSISPVTGAYGFWLDGCQNPGPVSVFNCAVQHHWEDAWRVTASHVTLVGCSGAYVGNGVRVDQDSISSSSGPPYNVNIVGQHSYYPVYSHLRFTQAKQVVSTGGFYEGDPNQTSPALGPAVYVDSTFSGFAGVYSPYRTRGSALVHYGAGAVRVDNTQDQSNLIWTGTGDGTPSGSEGLPTRRVTKNNGFATQSTSSTSQVAVIATAPGIAQGPSGNLRYTLRGRIKASTTSTGYQIGVIQGQNTYGPGNAAPGTPLWGALSRDTPPMGTDWEYFQIVYTYSGQNGFFRYTPVWNVIGTGTITTDMVTLDVEAF